MNSTIRPEDVIAVLRQLGRSQPDMATAVADMLQAAVDGRPQEIDSRGLTVDRKVLTRLIEACGNASPVKTLPSDARREGERLVKEGLFNNLGHFARDFHNQ